MRATPEGLRAASKEAAEAFAHLRDVNEQLVMAAIRSQDEADSATRAMQKVARAAELDALTALPNRTLLLDRFTHAAALARRHGSRLGVVFVDLNNFKQINDTLGHAAGDAVLRRTAESLVAAVRSADTVSRYGGDEFVVLLTDLAQPNDAAVIAAKINAAIGVPSREGDHVIRMTVSIGISIFPDDGSNADDLIAYADAAMYRAKRRGFGGFAFHTDPLAGALMMEPQVVEQLQRLVTRVDSSIAEREFREAELREANGNLVVALLGAKALQSDAEDARRRQTDFMGKLAHELRNPLAPMLNVAALLTGLHGGDASLPKLQSIIERQVLYMARLVDDLVEVSRVSTGNLSLNVRALDIASVIAESVENCRSSLDLRLQTFTTHFPAQATFVEGDRDRLRQVVCNLIDNASKYTPNNGEISLSIESANDSLVLTVSDNGIGIDEQALPGIFELFVQERRAVGFSGVGLGIGLAVVRELVHAHGGSVVAHSAGLGLGSQFVVTLPLALEVPPPIRIVD